MAREEILAIAKDLADKLSNSDEYKALKQAEADVKAHAAAEIMLKDLEAKQKACQEPGLSEEELKKRHDDLMKTLELVSHNPYVSKLLTAQMQLGQLWVEIQKILVEAIGINSERLGEPPDES
ncbi:MAG: hypothetical protein GX766_00715 [Firmicutes bacterium]|jgi:cell fate (sporulation/competence/biofilm development) regulator YlbF (YheA/YmcA/DUF963 family)|nr:hypothetical protein [Bacillota bacterium]HQD39985.1 YlbF family regulator [Bacillota bacterium]